MLRSSQPFYATFQSVNFLCTCLHVHGTIHLTIHVFHFCVYVSQMITYTHKTYKNETLAYRKDNANYKNSQSTGAYQILVSDQQPSQGPFEPLQLEEDAQD